MDVTGDVVRTQINYHFTSTGEDLISTNELRFRSQDELAQSLRDAGFSIERVCGDWDRSPVGAQSPELIFVAVRP